MKVTSAAPSGNTTRSARYADTWNSELARVNSSPSTKSGTAACSAGAKTMLAQVSRNSSGYTRGRLKAAANGMASTITARTRSIASSVRLRSKWSTSAPLTRPNSRYGSVDTTNTSPASASEPVTLRISATSATWWMRSPAVLRNDASSSRRTEPLTPPTLSEIRSAWVTACRIGRRRACTTDRVGRGAGVGTGRGEGGGASWVGKFSLYMGDRGDPPVQKKSPSPDRESRPHRHLSGRVLIHPAPAEKKKL